MSPPISTRHLHRLEEARTALGERASSARLLCIGSSFTDALRRVADDRTDIELVDLDRLYDGS